MIIGVPKEIKNNENRVALTPGGVHALSERDHSVIVESGAGEGSGISDADYAAAGAQLIECALDVWRAADIIVKVKEPVAPEYERLQRGQTLFTYLHLAAERTLTEELLQKQVTGIAYETVRLPDGSLPLLWPMSEVAGRMSVQIGAHLLQKYNGGAGVLLGGVPGVLPAQVLIIGGGVVGMNAARMAVGLGARVTVMDISSRRLAYLDDVFTGRICTLMYDRYSAAQMLKQTDLLIGAVLVAGEKAPKTVTEDMVKGMKKGSVIVDVAIDQGGCIETIDRVTTHDNPAYEKHGVLHYSVANMPGAVPRTSTFALTAVTLPYLLRLADKGAKAALLEDPALLEGLNTHRGRIACKGVADAFGLEYTPAAECLQLP